jgi:hypothetical protein
MAEEPFRSSYPRYDVLEKWDSPSWNEATRRAVDDRLHNVPPRRFFSEREYALLTALVETVLPQPERAPHERIPVAAFIDGVLYEDRASPTPCRSVRPGGAASPPSPPKPSGGTAARFRTCRGRCGRHC